MTYEYLHKDIFTADADYTHGHCISSDFVMGAGIAKLYTNRGVKQKLLDTYPTHIWNGHGYCLPVFMKNHVVLNLVTKELVYHKPTYKTLHEALTDAKIWLEQAYISGRIPAKKLVMPLIGCGLDGLDWNQVEPMIKDIFARTEFDILICEWP